MRKNKKKEKNNQKKKEKKELVVAIPKRKCAHQSSESEAGSTPFTTPQTTPHTTPLKIKGAGRHTTPVKNKAGRFFNDKEVALLAYSIGDELVRMQWTWT